MYENKRPNFCTPFGTEFFFNISYSSIWEREGEANPLSHKKMTTQMGSVAVNVLAMKQLYKYIKNHI
jgi:hypothetical protein